MKFISIRFMMLTMLPLIFIFNFFAEIKDRGKKCTGNLQAKIEFHSEKMTYLLDRE